MCCRLQGQAPPAVSSDADKAFAAKLAALAPDQATTIIAAADTTQANAGVANALRDLGNAVLANHPDQALTLYLDALQVAARLHDPLLTGSLLVNKGNAHRIAGRTEEALVDYDECLAVYAGLQPDPRSVARVHGFRATVRTDLGDLDGAMADYKIALENYRKLDDQVNVARTLNNLGGTEQDLGQLDKARESFEQGLVIARAQKQRLGEAYLLNNIGDVYLSENNPEMATEYALQSLRIKEEIGSKDDLVTSFLNLSRLYQQSGKADEALQMEKRAFAAASETGHASAMVIALFSWGALEADEKHFSPAMEKLTRALALSRQLSDRVHENEILAQIATTEVEMGHYTEAARDAGTVVASAKRMGFQQALSDASFTLGRAERGLGHMAAARSAFQISVDTIERMRDSVAGGDSARTEFFSHRAEAYKALAALAVTTGKPEQAFEISEREKGRALLDILTHGKVTLSSELNDSEKAEELRLRAHIATLEAQQSAAAANATSTTASGGTLQAARLAMAQFRERMYAAHPGLSRHRGDADLIHLQQTATLLQNSQSALLEYEVTQDATYLFVITASAHGPVLHVHEIRGSATALRTRVSALRTAIATRDPDFRDSATYLYRLLVEPAAAELKGKSSLVIVPSGELWHLPFQALLSPAGKFLVEDATISYAPSLSVLHAYDRRPQTARTADKLLALGDPQENLPAASREVRTLATLYGGGSAVLTGTEATRQNFEANAARYDIIHFATHGVFDDRNPMYSHLVLAAGQEAPHGASSQLDAMDVAEMRLTASMVVLSACETADGKYRDGEGLIGLSWSFLAAGSKAAVASQWRVESQSTTELMIEFHRRMQQHMSAPAALRAAQLHVSQEPRYRHPFYWAGFVLLGSS